MPAHEVPVRFTFLTLLIVVVTVLFLVWSRSLAVH